MINSFINAIVTSLHALSNTLNNIGNSIIVSLSNIDNSVITAFIGVAGTLLGTILGWLLNSFSQKGKLNIFVTSWQDDFKCREAGYMAKCNSASEAEYYSCKFSLDIYNSSAETRIMRNIQIVFSENKKVIMTRVPDDCATEHHGAHRISYDKIAPINIPPKSIVTVDLRFGEWNDDNLFEKYWKTNNISLLYTDKKNRVKKTLLCSKDYANYFQNTEETRNDEKG